MTEEPTRLPAAQGQRILCGLVTAGYRRHFRVHLDDGRDATCVLLGRSMAVACGDRVQVEMSNDNEGVIAAVEPRESLFFRSDMNRQKLIAANVTQLVAVIAPDPPFDDELVHRWLVAAESNRCRAVIVANKSDLPRFAQLTHRLAEYVTLGYPVVEVSALRDPAPLRPWLAHQRSALIGQSGMGKSTLINALLPGAAVRVGEVSAALHTGRHTTSETMLYRLDADSWIVDSPGMKEFGLAHLEADQITDAFVELRPLIGRCRFRNCSHGVEPGCVVQEAVASGSVRPWRVKLLQQLLAERSRSQRSW